MYVWTRGDSQGIPQPPETHTQTTANSQGQVNPRVGVCPGLFVNPWQTKDQDLMGSQLGHKWQSLGTEWIKENSPKPEPSKKRHYCQCLKVIAQPREPVEKLTHCSFTSE